MVKTVGVRTFVLGLVLKFKVLYRRSCYKTFFGMSYVGKYQVIFKSFYPIPSGESKICRVVKLSMMSAVCEPIMGV